MSDANPVGPSNKARHALRKGVRRVGVYPRGEVEHLRHYLAGRESVSVEQILLGHGSSHLLGLILSTIRPARVAAAGPARHPLAFYAERLGFTLDEVHPRGQGPDLRPDEEGFRDRLPGADLLLVSNPDRFTGTVLAPETLEALCAVAQKASKLLVVDESLADYVPLSRPQAHSAHPHRLILRTFSTFHSLAGLRLGYAIGPPGLLARISTFLEPHEIHTFAPRAAVASIKDKGFHRRTAEFLGEEKDYVLKELGKMAGVVGRASPANLFLVTFPTNVGVRDRLAGEGIEAEVVEDQAGRPTVRFPLRSHRDNAQFLRVLKKIDRDQSRS